MDLAELRAQLEEDLGWRSDELRLLRNSLLGELDKADWPSHAMRALLVMQYAHLEGFTQNAFHLYVRMVNEQRLPVDELHTNLLATSLADEFKILRSGASIGNQIEDEDDGTYLRRAKRHVNFVERVRSVSKGPLYVDPDHAVSMEMNLGADVLKKTMYMVGIPESSMDGSYFSSLEFVRRTRNDVGHGARTETIHPGLFEAHMTKCASFMNDLVRVVTAAVAEEWFRVNPESGAHAPR
jgi:HEPN superfamily protein